MARNRVGEELLGVRRTFPLGQEPGAEAGLAHSMPLDEARLEFVWGKADEESEEDAPIPRTFPEPYQAISVLSTLADRYEPANVERTAIELAEQTLRYIVGSGQSEAFLEEALKPCPPEKWERFGVLNDSS